MHPFLLIIPVILSGIFISYWMRRIDMCGFEIWLPMSIVISYAISPVVGFLVAFLILGGSFVLFPFRLRGGVIMIGCLAGTLAVTHFLPVTESNFMLIWMALVVGYNIVSNALWFFFTGNWLSAFKFFVLSIWTSWLIFSRFGWSLFLAFSG